jgi:hypothetical protein
MYESGTSTVGLVVEDWVESSCQMVTFGLATVVVPFECDWVVEVAAYT